MSYSRGGRGYAKPLSGAKVDWGHPWTRDLLGCWNFSEVGSLVVDSAKYGNGQLLGTTSVPQWQASDKGPNLGFVSANSQYIQVKDNPGYRLASWSIQVRFQLTTLRNFNGLVTKSDGSGNAAPFDMWVGSDGVLHAWTGATQLTTTLAAGVWYEVFFIHEHNQGVSLLYVDAVLKDAGNQSGVSDSAVDIRFGNRNDNATLLNGAIAYVRVWKRALLVNEVMGLGLYNSPYELMLPVPYRRYFVPAGPPPDPSAWAVPQNQPYVPKVEVFSY